MHPLRFSIVTYNIWGENRWDFRKDALRRFLEIFDPDVLCVQEFSAGARNLIDATLAGHRRVDDEFEGWTVEGNIYWRESLFSRIEHGAEEVQILKSPVRRLFWTRLQVKGFDRSIVVSTAHLTHQRHEQEARTGHSPRIGETSRIIEALGRVSRGSDAVFFMGDFNDPVHPTNLLKNAGYTSSFAALGLQPSSTFKVYPTAGIAPGQLAMSQCVDWIVASGSVRAVATSIPRFFHEDAAPSDHWPVHAIYELTNS
ncbi:MAG TPA: endonuclease/exonuclease/phosphatase family protein [Burkholderiales bacterium]|nr:endonuclease/exonuclease/phosphatase family protein [Burkholderiales bacterium]